MSKKKLPNINIDIVIASLCMNFLELTEYVRRKEKAAKATKYMDEFQLLTEELTFLLNAQELLRLSIWFLKQ